MMSEIMRQNSEILNFGMINKCKWEYFTSDWVWDNFNQTLDVEEVISDILVTIIR
jgi:hypothetical protein